MKISILAVGLLQANCYLVYDEQTKEALVIDPGAEGTRIYQEIERLRLKVKAIVNTHGHYDHIGGNQILRQRTGAPLYIHQADSDMLTEPNKNLSLYDFEKISSPEADHLVEEGDVLTIGTKRFRVLHTPGHTPGGICLVGEEVCFSGDTLFAGSVGRTDLPGGSTEQLFASIRSKLLVLDEATVVYPGHGPQTTIGQEKAANPFLNE